MAKLETFFGEPQWLVGNKIVTKVHLSERNLLALIAKLYTKGSRATVTNNNITVDGAQLPSYLSFAIIAQKDAVHYNDPSRGANNGPGFMHPTTQKMIDELKKVLESEQWEV